MNKSHIILPVFALILVLAYQNCGQKLGKLEDSSTGNASSDPVPFALQVDMNYMGYMSCRRDSTLIDNEYFSFRIAGAGAKSGLRLSSEFVTYMSDMSYEEISEAVTASPKHRALSAQFNIRSQSNLSEYVQENFNNGENVVFNQVFNVPMLNVPDYWLNISSQAAVPFSTSNPVKASLPLQVGNTNIYEDFLGKINSGEYVLSLNYPSVTKGNRYARSPAEYGEEDNMGIYGNIYRVHLSSNGKSLSQLEEFRADLNGSLNSQSNRGRNWDCSQRYKIVKPADGSDTNSIDVDGCNAPYVEFNSSPSHVALKNILGPNWKVAEAADGTKCVKPKVGIADKCYFNDFSVDYLNVNCSDEPSNSGQKLCPHYVSICRAL